MAKKTVHCDLELQDSSILSDSFIKKNGKNTQFLLADGTVNDNRKLQFSRTDIDTRGLNQDTWYPVSIQLLSLYSVIVYIDYLQKSPVSWSTHNSGSLIGGHIGLLSIGSGWGDNNAYNSLTTPLVFEAEHSWSAESGIQKIVLLGQLSQLVLYLRGGVLYTFNTSATVVLHHNDGGYVTDYGTFPLLTESPNSPILANIGLISEAYYNFDVNNIAPTQSNTRVASTKWMLRYLMQGVNWLRDNHLPLTGGTLSGNINAPQFIVPNGTAAQFLKADGSLDSNSYALHTDLNAVNNNAWKLDIANPECETVVITLQQGQGIFEAMEKAGIDYLKSRNIYVDLSKVSSIGGTNIDNLFSGYENLPVGVRYHIFFGNVQSSVKIYWLKPIESNIPYRVVGLTSDYPTAKCEFLRVTTDWTYADWEAAINQVDFSLDTGTASESDNSTLMNYMDNNKVSYSKTPKGALVNITTLLAALAGSK